MKYYVKVTLEDMYNKEQDLISIHYDLNQQVNTVFGALDKFRDLCILMDQPKPNEHLTNIAYIIFNKPKLFMDSLKL